MSVAEPPTKEQLTAVAARRGITCEAWQVEAARHLLRRGDLSVRQMAAGSVITSIVTAYLDDRDV